MKLYLIAALFLATLVVVPCLAEEEIKNGATANVADLPEDKPEGGGGSTGDEVQIKEEEAKESDEDVPKEFRDEVEQVKRRVPQLSYQSCVILKRYGYCRNRAIARFCVKVCNSGCIDKLSSLSCRKVKYTYRACNQNIGRVYCKKTCGHCGGPVQCRRYRTINDVTRRQSRPRGNVLLCDNKILQGWYRFVGNTGTYIPNRCVPSNRCGTHAAGWVVGNYPAKYQTVTRQVCFHWSRNCCYNARWWKIHIQITHCGSFYVFYLRRPRACYYRYCGNR